MKKLTLIFLLLLSLYIPAQAQVNLRNGLVAYYPFSGDAADSSGNGLDGTVSKAKLTTDRFGRSNSAYLFSGATDNYIAVPHDNSLNLNGSFSYCFWLNMDSVAPSTISAVLFKGHLGSNFYGYYVVTGSYDRFAVRNSSTSVSATGSGNYVPFGGWHFVTCVLDDAKGKMNYYVDDSLVESVNAISFAATNTQPLVIGRHFQNSDGSGGSEIPYSGKIDDVRIYNRALNRAEITALYKNQLPLNSCLIAYYPFSGDAADSSGNGLDGTVSKATLTTDRFGRSNSAYLFSGATDNYIAVPHDNSLNLNGSFSYCFWLNMDSVAPSTISAVLFKGHLGSNFYGYYVVTGSYDRFAVRNSSTSVSATGSGNYVPFGGWHFVTCVLDDAKGKMNYYVDDSLVESVNAISFAATNTQPLVIGRHFQNSDGSGGSEIPFRGKIDDVRIYGCALDRAEITALYKSQLTGIEAGAPKQGALRLYPNPSANGLFEISLGEQNESPLVTVLTPDGKEVLRVKQISNVLDLSHLAKGMYIIRAATATTVATGRVVIE